MAKRAAIDISSQQTLRGNRDALLQRAADEPDLSWRVLGTLNAFRGLIASALLIIFFASSEPRVFGDQYPTLFWITSAAYLLSAIVASIAGWRSNVAESELEQAVRGQVLKGSHQDLVDRGETWAMWSNIGWGVTGGAAALTLVFFLVDWLDDEPPGAIKMAPAMGPDGAGLVLECTF